MTRSEGAMGGGEGEEERGGKPAAAGTVDSTAGASVPAQTTLLTSKSKFGIIVTCDDVFFFACVDSRPGQRAGAERLLSSACRNRRCTCLTLL